jgi:hypothetical protein
MTTLLTIIALAGAVISVSAFAKSAPAAVVDAATVREQSSDVDTFEGRVVARIRMRNARSEASRSISESTAAYWGRSIF